MEQSEIDLVGESYKRCLEVPTFFEDFYAIFTAQGPHIREKFEKTDMDRQMHALKHGLQYMIMYATGSKIASAKIEDLALTHDRHHRNIVPEMYDAWTASLLKAVQKHDPQYSDTLGMSWRNVLDHGTRQLKAKY